MQSIGQFFIKNSAVLTLSLKEVFCAILLFTMQLLPKFSFPSILTFLSTFCLSLLCTTSVFGQSTTPYFTYTLGFKNPESNVYEVTLETGNWDKDTIQFKMPRWMPGYYQYMQYPTDVRDFKVTDSKGKELHVTQPKEHIWEVYGTKNKTLKLSYAVQTSKQFVANSFVDKEHAYIIPENSFMYVDHYVELPVSVKIELKGSNWKDIATGLAQQNSKANYKAVDFDFLYDCPILIGNLKALPEFKVQGLSHKFIGYKMGNFDGQQLMNDLEKMIIAASDLIGDIPYNEYTFLGIGPGRGGIEHLNSSAVSFNGEKLYDGRGYIGMLNFLAHEYFHHYNVKRIRPFELGPFDYENGSKTSQLWISEGLTSYYDNLLVRRAGLSTDEDVYATISRGITSYENNPGKHHQSLVDSSYETWHDGPFGKSGADPNKSISYYVKGPIVGLLLDFAIRHKTANQKSLDDVMRFMYYDYYKGKERGFTDAEFRLACETVAGASLQPLFEYVYTTAPLDYDTYLSYGGLQLQKQQDSEGKDVYSLTPIGKPTKKQKAILEAWLGNK